MPLFIPNGYHYTAQSTTYSANINDWIVASGASFTITLPSAANVAGRAIVIQHAGTSQTDVYTLDTTSSQTIGGIASGSYALYTNGETLTLLSDGSNWQIQDHKTIMAWKSYTPTFTGFGTATAISFYSRRVGNSLQVQGVFTAGTPTATAAEITLGVDGGNANVTVDNTMIAASSQAGVAAANLNGAYSLTVLAAGANNFVQFGVQASGSNGLTTANGSAIVGTGNVMSINLTAPIQNWQP